MASTGFPHIYSPGGAGRRRPAVPFEGDAPEVAAGDRVLCRDAGGEWHPRIALASPRYDHANAIGHTFLTVPVATPEEWAARGSASSWLNWPAEDVQADEALAQHERGK